MFAPLRQETMVVGQIGQSVDGRIATQSGHSHYINGADGLDHLHRLRAVVDAAVVGVGTAIADDPALTVRRVEGRNPARVVIDPDARLPATAKLLKSDQSRVIVVTKSGVRTNFSSRVEVIPAASSDRGFLPGDILTALKNLGLNRILIEGGANTVSRFIAAGCLDRLHIVVAPVLFGSGQPALTLPVIERADEAMRPPMRVHKIGDEILFDCDLSDQRVGGRAKKST